MDDKKKSAKSSIKSYEKKIKKTMMELDTYSPAMDFSISLAAGAYVAYLKVVKAIEGLEGVTTTKLSRENHEYKVLNPEFVALKDTADLCRKLFRELRLTRATIEGTDDDDEVEELIEAVENAGKE